MDNNNNKGFTILELLVTLNIGIVVLIILLPNLGGLLRRVIPATPEEVENCRAIGKKALYIRGIEGDWIFKRCTGAEFTPLDDSIKLR